MNTIRIEEDLPVKKAHDVVIAGAGVAGVSAAIAARRAGKSVLLLEKQIQLGGLATIGLINYFVPMCNGHGVNIIKGLCKELLKLSVKDGFDSLPKAWKEGKDHPTKEPSVRYVTGYSPTIFSMNLTELLIKEGVELLLDCQASEPLMKGGHAEGVIVQSKAGREFYPAKVLVDATGDSDLLYRAGVPTVTRHNFFTYMGYRADLESCKKVTETGDIRWLYRLYGGGEINLHGDHQPDDVPLYYGTTPEDITDYVIRNQAVMLEKLRKEDRKSREIVTLPIMPQFRTTRRIDGDYTLTMEDEYKHFEDSICVINDFGHNDRIFEVPYRTLVSKHFDNMITAGRSASGDGYAWDCLRVIPPAILTGQAAGEAAALAIETGTPIAEVHIPELQRRLSENRMMIHFDDALVP